MLLSWNHVVLHATEYRIVKILLGFLIGKVSNHTLAIIYILPENVYKFCPWTNSLNNDFTQWKHEAKKKVKKYTPVHTNKNLLFMCFYVHFAHGLHSFLMPLFFLVRYRTVWRVKRTASNYGILYLRTHWRNWWLLQACLPISRKGTITL